MRSGIAGCISCSRPFLLDRGSRRPSVRLLQGRAWTLPRNSRKLGSLRCPRAPLHELSRRPRTSRRRRARRSSAAGSAPSRPARRRLALHACAVLPQAVLVLRLPHAGHRSPTRRWRPTSTRLKAEIALVADALARGRHGRGMHWGGGTPTLLRPDMIARTGRGGRGDGALRRRTPSSRSRSTPTRSTRRGSTRWPGGGMTRASIGVQDFDPVIQKAIGRAQSFEVTEAAVDGLRARGVDQPQRRHPLRPAPPDARAASPTPCSRCCRSRPTGWRSTATPMCPGWPGGSA